MSSTHSKLIWWHFSTSFWTGILACNIRNNILSKLALLENNFINFLLVEFDKKREKTRLKLKFFSCHNINMELLWLILKWYTIIEDFFLLGSVRYHDDVKTILKFDWSNLKILMSGWYRKLTSSCVSFTMYQQWSWPYRGWCHSNIVTISECPLGSCRSY